MPTMSKEAKIKARITKLNKHSKEQLINIILNKDKESNKFNVKIAKLSKCLANKNYECDKLNKALSIAQDKIVCFERENKNFLDKYKDAEFKIISLNKTKLYLIGLLIVSVITIISMIMIR